MFFPTLLIACEQFVPCAQEKSLSCGVGCATGGLLLGCEGAAGPGSSPAQGRVRQSTLPTATSSWVFNISTDGDRQALWAMYSCVCLLSKDFFFFLIMFDHNLSFSYAGATPRRMFFTPPFRYFYTLTTSS